MGDYRITLLYALPLCLLVAIWFGRWGSMRLRLALTVLLPLIYVAHWYALRDLQGWPATAPLPERFQLIAADVVEPSQRHRGEPEIRLWVVGEGESRPRAIRQPYSRQLHKMLHEARAKNLAGQPQTGVMRTDDGSGRGALLDGGRRLEFEDSPRSRLPPKR